MSGSFALLAAGAAVAVLSLTACSGSGGDADGGATADMVAPAAGDVPAAMEGGGAGALQDDASGGGQDSGKSNPDNPGNPGSAVNAADLITQQALIKTGAVALRSKDVGKARYDVQVIVDAHNGQVSDDKTETDKSGSPLRSRMVLRVPVADFDDVMDALAKVGTLASTTTSSEDVTTQLIDVQARIKVQQDSVDRVRQLLARAASIRDIMSIENELANRQAQLDSLLQQQAYLADQTSMSTIKVNIARTADAKKATPKKDDDGFLAGLSSGWTGLKKTVVAVATVVGAVLPFAVVVLLLGVPVWILVRRLRRHPAPPPAVSPAPTD